MAYKSLFKYPFDCSSSSYSSLSNMRTWLTLIVLSGYRTQAFQLGRPDPRSTSHSLRLQSSITGAVIPLSDDDVTYLRLAMDCAKYGLGHTFPNPAVGCVLVEQDRGIIGKGFHPRAGFPHAEIFALFEAAGFVKDGVAAATSVLNKNEDTDLVRELTAKYASPEGAHELFGNLFTKRDKPVTAYVTLEPCCHTGRTPPCAATFALAKVDRVVVGFRDPNPRVDGGGVKFLREAGITVQLASESDSALENSSLRLVTNFCKRITPRPDVWPSNYNEIITGAMRRNLRAVAGRLKSNGQLAQVKWGGEAFNEMEDLDTYIDNVQLKPEWMEHVDEVLWEKELVLLRLNTAVGKKKGAKALGQKVADQLQAHVAQTVGHTCLLYRPASPPLLDIMSSAQNPSNM